MTDSDDGTVSGDLPPPRPGYYPAPATAPPPAGDPPVRRAAAADEPHRGRRAGQRRAYLVICAAMSVVVLFLSGAAWGFTSYINDSIAVNAGTAGTPSSGPLNILLAGVAMRSGLTRHQQLALHVGDRWLQLRHADADPRVRRPQSRHRGQPAPRTPG